MTGRTREPEPVDNTAMFVAALLAIIRECDRSHKRNRIEVIEMIRERARAAIRKMLDENPA